MKPKRAVSGNLGRTQHRKAARLYSVIRRRIGAHRRCPFYSGKKYPQFGPNEHDRLNPGFPNPRVSIEQFDFQYDKRRRLWTLQAYCKVCYKAYRDARIGKARSTWVRKDGARMTEREVRAWYRKNVGSTMRCSVCHRNLDPAQFRMSPSMEKGLHNVCLECTAGPGTSVREQEWLSDGDWDSWRRAVTLMRISKKVKCSGWPRSKAMGECLDYDHGKRMHADHRVPLRAGGLNDATNFQPLCGPCNVRKSHQIDSRLSITTIRALVAPRYRHLVRAGDSIPTIERKLKAAVRGRLRLFIKRGSYLNAIRAKKKEVNGQWDPNRAYRKGLEWMKKIDGSEN